MNLGAALMLAVSLVHMPPPLCRGKQAPRYDPRFDREPTSRAVAEVQMAYDALCPNQRCGTGQLFENETLGNNAVTWVSGLRDGAQTRAKIVYSSKFLNSLNDTFGAGASFGVLAHEIGHHLTAALAMRNRFDSSWDEELRADYLAGCALGRSGRTADELQHTLRALAQVASPTHPSFKQRIPVVQRGYRDCAKDARDFAVSRKPFGLGEELRRRARAEGCWSYWYRLESDIARVGPIAAKVRRSGVFSSNQRCEAHLGRVKGRMTGACACERQSR